MTFKKYEKNYLLQLVTDCIVYRLGEEEALKYIHVHLGRPISPAHYYRVKRYVQSQEANAKWLDDEVFVYKVSTVRLCIDEIERLSAKAWHLLLAEETKGVGSKDGHLVTKLISQLRANNQYLYELAHTKDSMARFKSRVQEFKKECENSKAANNTSIDDMAKSFLIDAGD